MGSLLADVTSGIRFGARHGRIFRMMVGQGLWLSAVGIAGGLAAALLLT